MSRGDIDKAHWGSSMGVSSSRAHPFSMMARILRTNRKSQGHLGSQLTTGTFFLFQSILLPKASHTVTILAGRNMFSADTCVPPLGYQTIETIEPKELEFPQESNAGEGKSCCLVPAAAGGRGRGICLSFSRVLTACQVTL